VIGRQFDYPSGYNLVTQPRQSEPITFEQLRGLADAYDLMRLAIETRKDQIAKLGWIIRPRIGTDGHPRTGHDDPRIAQASEFFARPDREHGWDSWLRMLVEDMLVIDAATVYPRRDLAGRLLALEPIDGATIKRVLDDRGRTPEPPYPAYQQILKGLPAVDYKADELYYLPRNVRSHRVYGYSPVEQVVMTVNIALRRQMHQLQYYTEGNVPEALIGVPEAWTPDQIGQFQSYWDALLEGDTAQRRHARFVPATISKSFVQTKDAGLKDDYDEWLARIVCFAFSISPQALVKAMNRATAETAHDQALQEGLLPLMRWVKELVDRALREGFGWGDLEFAWQEANEVDPLTQAKIAQVYLAAGVLTPAEVRASLGLGAEGKGGAANAGRPFGKFDINQARDAFGRWVAEGEAAVASEATRVGNVLKPLSSGAAVGGAVGAVVGGGAAVVGSVVADVGTGGLNILATPEEVALGATAGGLIGREIGRRIDETFDGHPSSSSVYGEEVPDGAVFSVPGKPTDEDGYFPPKNWDGKKVAAPNGRGYGWPDKDGDVWVPSGADGHGGPHWDVQDGKTGRNHKNVRPKKSGGQK